MNELQIFNNPEFGEVRTLEEDGQVLFCGIDVARALGYAKPSGAVSRFCPHALKRGIGVQTGERGDGTPAMQNVETAFIPESDLYRLVFRSQLPSAERFTDWITEEVLPSIRRTGSYQIAPRTPAELLAAQAQMMVDMERRLDRFETQTHALADKVDTAIKVFSRPAEDHWKSDVDSAIKELCEANHLSVAKTKGFMYAELERTTGCLVNSRLKRMQKRVRKTGARYKDAHALTKLDAVAADRQLRAVFEGIVRNWQARYAINAEYEEVEILEV